eukprot:scaffold299373_cov12-Tisochrysis_lutea.AAC.1
MHHRTLQSSCGAPLRTTRVGILRRVPAASVNNRRSIMIKAISSPGLLEKTKEEEKISQSQDPASTVGCPRVSSVTPNTKGYFTVAGVCACRRVSPGWKYLVALEFVDSGQTSTTLLFF